MYSFIHPSDNTRNMILFPLPPTQNSIWETMYTALLYCYYYCFIPALVFRLLHHSFNLLKSAAAPYSVVTTSHDGNNHVTCYDRTLLPWHMALTHGLAPWHGYIYSMPFFHSSVDSLSSSTIPIWPYTLCRSWHYKESPSYTTRRRELTGLFLPARSKWPSLIKNTLGFSTIQKPYHITNHLHHSKEPTLRYYHFQRQPIPSRNESYIAFQRNRSPPRISAPPEFHSQIVQQTTLSREHSFSGTEG